MKFNNMMHVAFFTDRMDEMMAFYCDKLGCKVKVLTRYRVYLDRDDRPAMQDIARKDPDRIFSAYLEIAPGQFVELFPRGENQLDRDSAPWNGRLGYSHFALTVDDIYAAREELVAAGVTPDTEISKGPSETYQFWVSDPDGNKFEVMQYTDKSYQVVGHID
jgi:catechol 2,3-dioxygenase-like lactoylglutathione lyase family enzyme